MFNKRSRFLNIVRGGIGIPIARNTFLMRGRTHEQGGIDIGESEKNGLEVEGNEIVKVGSKDIKVLSAQPILNGQSPAMLALRGNSFDKIFNAQERFKRVNHLNDDGSKMNKKFAIGGDEPFSLTKFNKEVTKNFKPEINTKDKWGRTDFVKEMYKYILNNGLQRFLTKSPYKDNIDDVNRRVHDVTDDFQNNDVKIKDYLSTNNKFYKDNENNKIYALSERGIYNTDGLVKLTNSEVKSLLPKRDYIGGNNARKDFISRSPELTNLIKSKANSYGINPNLLAHIFSTEGWIDNEINYYNNIPANSQKDYFNFILPDKMNNESISGFDRLGLDTVADELLNNRYELKDKNASWTDSYHTNEKRQRVHSVNPTDMNSAMEITAAALAYRQNELIKRGYSKEGIEPFVRGAYNMGLYHKDLNDKNYILSKYGNIPNYFKFGGNMNLINNLPRKGKQFAFGGDDKKKQKDYHRDALPLGMRFKTFIGAIGDVIKEKINPTTDEERWYRFIEYLNDRNSIYNPIRMPIIRRNNYNFRQPDSTVIDRAKIKEFKCGGRHKAALGSLRTTPWGTITYTPSLSDTLSQPLMYANTFNPGSIYDTIAKTKPASDTANTDKQSFWNTIKTNMGPADWLNLGTTAVNTIGNIASYAINNRMLNRLTYPRIPIQLSAEKMKTNFNINPQLDNVRNMINSNISDVAHNTASSRGYMQRAGLLRGSGLDYANQLYGAKENYETQLINQDKSNRQSVAAANLERYNNWDAKRHGFFNTIKDKKSENAITHLIQNPASDMARFADNYQKITKYDNDLLMSTIPYPEAFRLMFGPAITKNGIDKNAWVRNYARGRIGYNLFE